MQKLTTTLYLMTKTSKIKGAVSVRRNNNFRRVGYGA